MDLNMLDLVLSGQDPSEFSGFGRASGVGSLYRVLLDTPRDLGRVYLPLEISGRSCAAELDDPLSADPREGMAVAIRRTPARGGFPGSPF
jgi:hypothetical protein